MKLYNNYYTAWTLCQKNKNKIRPVYRENVNINNVPYQQISQQVVYELKITEHPAALPLSGADILGTIMDNLL